MAVFYIVIAVIAVLMLALLIPVDCVIDLSYNDKENRGAVIIKYLFFKFKIFPMEKEAEEIGKDIERETDEPAKDKKDITGMIKFARTVYAELKPEILRLLNHFFTHTIEIRELNISSRFGTGDPMYTGIASGAVNAAVYNTVSVIDRHMTLDKWNVSLEPDFDNACMAVGVYIRIRTRIAYVIKLGFMAAVLLLRIKKVSRRIKDNG